MVTIGIAGRRYPVACGDGEEEHIAALAAYLDERATEISDAVGGVGEARLLVMTGLSIADRMDEALDEARREIEDLRRRAEAAEEKGRAAAEAALEARFTPILETLAARIEGIAAHLENE